MKKLSKKIIISSVAKVMGVKEDYIDLFKSEGNYHWAGKAGSVFTDSNCYVSRLTDRNIDYWIAKFKQEAESTIEYTEFHDLNSYIESIDWNVEFEQ